MRRSDKIGIVILTSIVLLAIVALLFVASFFPRPLDLVLSFLLGLWFAGAPARDHWNALMRDDHDSEG